MSLIVTLLKYLQLSVKVNDSSVSPPLYAICFLLSFLFEQKCQYSLTVTFPIKHFQVFSIGIHSNIITRIKQLGTCITQLTYKQRHTT